MIMRYRLYNTCITSQTRQGGKQLMKDQRQHLGIAKCQDEKVVLSRPSG